jgi:dihydrodipicolinate synthase/N-acetylneuraminate lyase
MLTRENFSGPWAGLPVAWTERDEFDEDTYRGDVVRCCQAGIPGVYTGGTSGEFYAQEWEEFQQIARATVEECHRHNTPAMIGCTALSTRAAARRAAFAKEIGADAIQVALPFWMEVPDDQVLPFFVAVAGAASGVALSIYETRRAKKCLTIEQHLAIHRALPQQYLMVKANENTIGYTPEGCQALSSVVNVFVDETRWADLGQLGANGCCSAVVYYNPRVVLQMWRQHQTQQWQALQTECDRVAAMYAAIFAAFGPRGFTDTAYDRLGGIATGFLKSSLYSRGPYPSPNADDIATLRQIFETHLPEMLHL